MEEWAAVCRHVKAVEEDYMSREHEMDSVIERIIINADDDDDDNDETQNLQLVVTIMMIYKELFQSSVTASEVKWSD